MGRGARVTTLAGAILLLAACLPREPTVRLDVPFAQRGARQLLLDAYLPDEPGAHPAVILIHGGGWAGGSRTDVAALARRIAEDGFAAFAVDYRLAPGSPFPAALEDVREAVRWLRTNAREFRVDPERVVALGTSAGGHLAALLAVSGRDGVRAAVSWSGPLDLRRTISEAPAEARKQVRDMVEAFLACHGAACAPRLEAASPLAQVDALDAPLLVANSRGEATSVAQARSMLDALRRSGVPGGLIEVYGGLHGEEYADVRTAPSGESVLESSLAFLRTWTGPDAPRTVPGGGGSPAALALSLAGAAALGLGVAWARRRVRRLVAAPAGVPSADAATIARIDELGRLGLTQGEISRAVATRI